MFTFVFSNVVNLSDSMFSVRDRGPEAALPHRACSIFSTKTALKGEVIISGGYFYLFLLKLQKLEYPTGSIFEARTDLDATLCQDSVHGESAKSVVAPDRFGDKEIGEGTKCCVKQASPALVFKGARNRGSGW